MIFRIYQYFPRIDNGHLLSNSQHLQVILKLGDISLIGTYQTSLYKKTQKPPKHISWHLLKEGIQLYIRVCFVNFVWWGRGSLRYRKYGTSPEWSHL